MQDEKLTLQEKEERWLKAVNRKHIDNIQTDEEYYYEIEEFQVLFEDERIRLTVEYGNEYAVRLKKENGEVYGGMSFGTPIEMCIDTPFSEYLKQDFEEKNLREYLRKRGFPINFKTWD